MYVKKVRSSKKYVSQKSTYVKRKQTQFCFAWLCSLNSILGGNFLAISLFEPPNKIADFVYKDLCNTAELRKEVKDVQFHPVKMLLFMKFSD